MRTLGAVDRGLDWEKHVELFRASNLPLFPRLGRRILGVAVSAVLALLALAPPPAHAQFDWAEHNLRDSGPLFWLP